MVRKQQRRIPVEEYRSGDECPDCGGVLFTRSSQAVSDKTHEKRIACRSCDFASKYCEASELIRRRRG